MGGDLVASVGAQKRLEGFLFEGPSTTINPRDGSVLFLQSAAPEALERLRGLRGCLIILPPGADSRELEEANIVFRARNPKYEYARLMTSLFPLVTQRGRLVSEPAPDVRAASDFVLAEGVTLEPFVTIGRDSTIGRGSYVMKGASIGPRVHIGEGCMIGEGAVIGGLGFGFAFDKARPPIRIPQLGGVRIGDRVEVGHLSCVDSGTIEPAVVEDDVKISSHVHIAHNCEIGAGSILVAAVSVSGSTRVGERCWLAPGALVRNKLTLGEGVTVGMGAVVVKDVAARQTVTGVPARPTGTTMPWYESERGTP